MRAGQRLMVWVIVGLLASGACAGGEGRSGAPAPAAPANPPATAPTVGPAAAEAPTVAAGALTRLAIPYSTTSASNSPLQLAQDQGIFRANGFDVELLHAPGNAAAAAVVSGQAPVMVSACAETIGAVAAGADLVFWLQPTHRMQYMLAGGPNVPTREELKGKRLAVSRLGTTSHLATKFILRHIGLDAEQDVSYVQIGNTPERVVALLAGSVDATILSADEGKLVGAQPGVRILVDMTHENVTHCSNGVAAARQFVRDSPEVMRRLARALMEAQVRYKLNRTEGLEAVSRFLDEHDPQKVEAIWDTWRQLFVDKPYPDARAMQFTIEEGAQTDPRLMSLSAEQLIDPTWVRELDQSGYIDELQRRVSAR
jgi:NitT/TauT family transport system substrate-binding protein